MLLTHTHTYLFSYEFFRSHLREIRDRSVLRLFESNEVAAPQALPGGPGIPLPQPVPQVGSWDHDQVGYLIVNVRIKDFF